jgi:hypothetical protein
MEPECPSLNMAHSDTGPLDPFSESPVLLLLSHPSVMAEAFPREIKFLA